MDNKIINFNQKKSLYSDHLLTKDDIFNLLLIYKHNEEILSTFNLDVVMKSLAKYKKLERFSKLCSNLDVEINELGIEIVNLVECLEKKKKEKVVIENPNRKMEIIVLGNGEYYNTLKEKYSKKNILMFADLMFFINNDLEYGMDNWQIIFEDEYIEDPIYGGIVTGEIINVEKDEKTMKKVRKIAKEINYKK